MARLWRFARFRALELSGGKRRASVRSMSDLVCSVMWCLLGLLVPPVVAQEKPLERSFLAGWSASTGRGVYAGADALPAAGAAAAGRAACGSQPIWRTLAGATHGATPALGRCARFGSRRMACDDWISRACGAAARRAATLGDRGFGRGEAAGGHGPGALPCRIGEHGFAGRWSPDGRHSTSHARDHLDAGAGQRHARAAGVSGTIVR